MAENTIPLEQAQTWRSNWKSSYKAWIAANDFQGFLVPGDDILQVLGEEGVNCRVYMGLTESGTGGKPKAMMVAVDASGKDMIDPGNGYNIYDDTLEIPPNGDSSSPLN